MMMTLIAFIPAFAINNKPVKESDVEIIQNLYASFAKGDVLAVLQMFDPKIIWNEAENFPYADRNTSSFDLISSKFICF